MIRWIAIAVLVTGCSKKEKEGLPPAQEWSADTSGMVQPGNTPANPHVANPHGADMGGAAGMAGSALPPGHPDIGGSAGGVDVSKLGFNSPDPNRAIDPTRHIRGTIAIHPKAADRAQPGGTVFVFAKKIGPDGNPMPMPLAAQKLAWDGKDLAFELSDANAMVDGTQLTGEVMLMARYDHDGDVMSKQPGDITGEMKVKIPSEGVKLYLDTILP